MTPEKAFDTGARIHLTEARLVSERHGRFLVGVVAEGSHEEVKPGALLVTTYINREIYPDVYLMRNGFTVFVDHWDLAKQAAAE